MVRKKKNLENSEAEVESAIENEMDVIGAGEIPEDVKAEEKQEDK